MRLKAKSFQSHSFYDRVEKHQNTLKNVKRSAAGI